MFNQILAAEATSISSMGFRSVMGSFPTGVTIITTNAEDGTDVGMTVNAITSVSLEPPQLLICLAKSRFTAQAIADCGSFAVNFLSNDQQEVAGLFATNSPEKFKHVEVERGMLGMPLITDSLARAECRVNRMIEAGDHTIFIGDVVTGAAVEGQPLIYFRSGYNELMEARGLTK